MYAFYAFIFGLVFGSFYNVVIYRVPRKLSIVKPSSKCPSCETALTSLELIPVVSFVLQKGRCKNCGAPIHWRYPVVELITGVGFVIVLLNSTTWTSLVVGIIFFSLLLILGLIDLEHKILPNLLTLPGTALGLLFALCGWSLSFWQSALGALAGFLVMFLLVLISRGGMGMGDVKLMAMIGAFLGWKAVFFVLFGASILGSVGGILYLYFTKQGRKTPIPFGPCLVLAAFTIFAFF